MKKILSLLGFSVKEHKVKLRNGGANRFGIAALGITLFTVINPNLARAESGAYNFGEVIIERACPQVFGVALGNSFSIIRVVAGPQVNGRDILAGDLNSIGLVDAVNKTRGNAPTRVIVLDSLLSDTQFGSHLERYCNG